MKNKLTPFQMIFFGVLVFIIVAGVIIFSARRAGNSGQAVTVTAWGTFPENIINEVVKEINFIERDSISLNYRQISHQNFEAEMIDALAAGRGPDLFFMSNDLIVKHQDKLYNIPYSSYPQKAFKENFIEAAEVLIHNDGIIGFPYMIDPLVLYWNRSALNSAGISKPPEYWDQLISMVPRLTALSDDLRVLKSAISFGEFRNIKNAKDILVTLITQAGNPIVSRSKNPGSGTLFTGTLFDSMGFVTKPANAALNYFTQFSNPSLNTYTWNRSLPNSEDMFLSGDLAFYIGYASEYVTLREKNPNLNFDVAVIPQSRNADSVDTVIGKKTLGRLIFIGIANNTRRVVPALQAINTLTTKGNLELLTNMTNLPPVHRSLLLSQSDNAIMQTFYESAMISVPFLDPNPTDTNQIFLEMVESFTSGRSGLTEVISRAHSQINDILK